MKSETLTVVCPCGAIYRTTIEHYQKVMPKCGRTYWALQPHRNGPLQLFPWPGPNLTREQMKERAAA